MKEYRIIYFREGMVEPSAGSWYPFDDTGANYITSVALAGELYDVETR